MLGFRKKEQRVAASVQTRPEESFRLGRGAPPGPGERALYRALRENVPIIDASIYKLRRLLGSFQVECPDKAAQEALERFLADVPVNAAGQGIDAFLGTYFEDLLTYGNAVGEMVVSGGQVSALYNASLECVAGAGRPLGGENFGVEREQAQGMPLSPAAADLRPEPGGRFRPGDVPAAGAALCK